MGWADRVSNGTIRFYEAIRSRRTREALAGDPGGDLRSLAGHRYALVITFRGNGEPVPTPVWFGVHDGRMYFRSVSTGAKLRRIARRPDVLVAPCRANGRPVGEVFRGHARLLVSAQDQATAEAAIGGNQGLGRRFYVRLIAPRVPGIYVEVSPVRDPSRTAGGCGAAAAAVHVPQATRAPI